MSDSVNDYIMSHVWRKVTTLEEELEILQKLINSRMGIGMLNQVTLEGFIGYDCERTFYRGHDTMDWLMRIRCSTPRGVSAALGGFEEVRVVMGGFEGKIEDFEIQRISDEAGRAPDIPLIDSSD